MTHTPQDVGKPHSILFAERMGGRVNTDKSESFYSEIIRYFAT